MTDDTQTTGDAAGAPPAVPGSAPDAAPGVQDRPAQAVHSPPPVETPGPSVTPPDLPESETERAERADATVPDAQALEERTGDPVDALLAEQESAAAAEAAAIGGPAPGPVAQDPAMAPVYEAGGGVAEGFEEAEADLIENAQHRDGPGNPLRDAPTPEAEADLSGAAYGEGDRVESTEVLRDPDVDPEADPGAGPNLGADR